MRTLTILGSTGSIGTQTLDIVRQFKDDFFINVLTANTRIKELEAQIREFNPKAVAISNENAWKEFRNTTSFKGEILCGEEGVIAAASHPDNDIVMQALVGFSGVAPTLAAIEQGATIALANKETLVSAGSIVMKSAEEKQVPILAVDSEHSAILQCMAGEERSMIDKIIRCARSWSNDGEAAPPAAAAGPAAALRTDGRARRGVCDAGVPAAHHQPQKL